MRWLRNAWATATCTYTSMKATWTVSPFLEMVYSAFASATHPATCWRKTSLSVDVKSSILLALLCTSHHRCPQQLKLPPVGWIHQRRWSYLWKSVLLEYPPNWFQLSQLIRHFRWKFDCFWWLFYQKVPAASSLISAQCIPSQSNPERRSCQRAKRPVAFARPKACVDGSWSAWVLKRDLSS